MRKVLSLLFVIFISILIVGCDKKSNIDDTIVRYKPGITVSQKLIGGSTEHWESCSVERGNEHFKKALAMGFKRVVKRSWA